MSNGTAEQRTTGSSNSLHMNGNSESRPQGTECLNGEEFIQFAGAAAEYIVNYLNTVRDREVVPPIEPGFLRKQLPNEAPQRGEPWQDVLADFDRIIVPGMTHWMSPNFHAFYPTASSFAAIVGEMLSAGMACVGLSWMASPVCTELEAIVMDWLARLFDLPEHFLNSADSPGGGVIQGSASEATLVCFLAANEKAVKRIRTADPTAEPALVKTRLVAYTSDQANSSVEKAGLLASVPMRLLPADAEGRLRADVLQRAIEEDKARGLTPSYVVATLGTTPTCAFDYLPEIAAVCRKEGIWLHVDAAYAGAAFVCPEYRHLMAGVELADSFNINIHKWLLVNFDCSALWVRDSHELIQAFTVDRIYLAQHKRQGMTPEYRIALGRRFRALKLWIVLRMFGAEGLRSHIRHQVALAAGFAALVRGDPRFELVSCSLGLVCFRLKGDNALTQALLDVLTARRRIYLIAGGLHDQLVIRFAICSRFTQRRDVEFAWDEIRSQTDVLVPPVKKATAALPTGVSENHAAPSANGHAATNGVAEG